MQQESIFSQLQLLGLTTEEIEVYLYLLQTRNASALALSRELNYPRTRIYRILDSLLEKEIIQQKYEELGHVFFVVTYTDLSKIIKKEEQDVKILRKSLPILEQQIIESVSHLDGSKVMYYRGTEGLKHVAWNTLNAQTELLIIEQADSSLFLKLEYEFIEKIRQKYVEKEINVREITNQDYFEDWTENTTFIKNFWDSRYIDPALLELKLEFFIYNDVYVLYVNTETEFFAAEIHDKNLVDMERQIFEYIWRRSKKMKIGPKGEGRALV